MFTGNQTSNRRNPDAGTGLLWLLGVVGLGYGAYKIFIEKKPVAAPQNGSPPGPTPTPEPTGPTTTVQDSVKGTMYEAPLPGARPSGHATRQELGLQGAAPALKENDYAAYIETWPTGAEVLWGRVVQRPNAQQYGLYIVDNVPYEGATHDTRPIHQAHHQKNVGTGSLIQIDEIVDTIIL